MVKKQKKRGKFKLPRFDFTGGFKTPSVKLKVNIGWYPGNPECPLLALHLLERRNYMGGKHWEDFVLVGIDMFYFHVGLYVENCEEYPD